MSRLSARERVPLAAVGAQPLERLEVAAKLQAEREDAAAHATRELEGRLHAAESAAEAGAAEVDRLNAAVVSLRSEVTDAGGITAEAAAKIAHLEDELAAADEMIMEQTTMAGYDVCQGR